ncbi:unnamed protein product [Chilo suppressalis]|uniref:FP protein C-terminal domain-containing protein n=1 Tax=Chilo suppressalis TaxID=168631 RepID=A0ABN8AYI0_CHISP|nr:unnamed protein product [Chilo suppressalis]
MMRRSPPPVAVPANVLTIQGNDSDTASENSGKSNFAMRAKRKKEIVDCSEFNDFKTELRASFASLSKTVEQRFSDVKQQYEEMQKSVQFMSDKYDKILESLQVMEQERLNDKKYIKQLEDKVDFFERKIKATGLEIRNVPSVSQKEDNHESKQELLDIVKNLAQSVNTELQDYDIRDIYRVSSKKESAKPIIVELNSVISKEKILQAVKVYNKEAPKESKLNTINLKIPGTQRPVFVSESLTMKTQRLFYLAREFARDNEFTYCWTSKGYVYLRKAENLPFTRIDCDEDLAKLRRKI